MCSNFLHDKSLKILADLNIYMKYIHISAISANVGILFTLYACLRCFEKSVVSDFEEEFLIQYVRMTLTFF